MAVGVLIAGPGVTRESYQQLTEKMFGKFPIEDSDSPEGAILHSAGQSDQGWYIYDVWESREAFGRFAETRLGPAVHELMGDDAPKLEPQFFDIEVLSLAR